MLLTLQSKWVTVFPEIVKWLSLNTWYLFYVLLWMRYVFDTFANLCTLLLFYMLHRGPTFLICGCKPKEVKSKDKDTFSWKCTIFSCLLHIRKGNFRKRCNISSHYCLKFTRENSYRVRISKILLLENCPQRFCTMARDNFFTQRCLIFQTIKV